MWDRDELELQFSAKDLMSIICLYDIAQAEKCRAQMSMFTRDAIFRGTYILQFAHIMIKGEDVRFS